ncbi:MAG: ATP-binding protein, partial [Tannerella sp.]|nr:ATP-binding protein [Tannerella sp.]
YDHFANDLIAQGTHAGDSVYRHVVRANGIIRDFYETLKEGSKAVIDRIILTGITPIMLDDITSGFNISNNISLKPKYNELLGFTKEEVNTLMEESGIDPGMIRVDMEYLYDGYLFHSEGENRVYNPSMMLYLFDQVQEDGKIRNITDENLKTDYSRLQMLMQNEDNRRQLTQIIKDNVIKSEIIPKFPIDKLHDNEYFISLLFYLGLLTVDKFENGLLRLKIPNYSVQTIYWGYIKEMTKEDNPDVLINMDQQRIALSELAYRGNPSLFVEHISENIFKRLSNRDIIAFDEKYIKIIILNGLFQSNLYVTVSELEVSIGYADIYMHRNPAIPGIPYEWVWEIKYVKKKDASRSVLKTKREEARIQLKKYRDSYRFAGRADVRYLSLIFIGKDRYEMEEISG